MSAGGAPAMDLGPPRRVAGPGQPEGHRRLGAGRQVDQAGRSGRSSGPEAPPRSGRGCVQAAGAGSAFHIETAETEARVAPVTTTLEAGQFSLHADMLVHASLPNRSGRRHCGLTPLLPARRAHHRPGPGARGGGDPVPGENREGRWRRRPRAGPFRRRRARWRCRRRGACAAASPAITRRTVSGRCATDECRPTCRVGPVPPTMGRGPGMRTARTCASAANQIVQITRRR